jgi:hypothetical protein
MEQFGPGKTISFRLPSDTPPHVSDYLTKRKHDLGRKFSGEMAPLFVDAVSKKALGKDIKDELTISIPTGLTSQQKEWLSHPHTRALISQLLYQVVTKPEVGFEFKPSSASEPKQEETAGFKTNSMIQRFAEKTFLNFDEDDD